MASLPSQATESMMELFAIPGFSKLWLKPPGSPSTLIRWLFFRGDAWDVVLAPIDFIQGVPKSVLVSVCLHGGKSSASRINVSMEILDNTWERAVFHEEGIVGGGDAWHMSMRLNRSDLEVTSCVHNDNIPVRCTLTFIDVKKQKRKRKAAARSKWWHQLRGSLYRNLLSLKCNSNISQASMMMTDKKPDVIPYSCSSPSTIHHSITISCYSKFAQMPTASSLTLRKFRFLGCTWCIILYPNEASNETPADSIAIKAVRHSASDLSVVHSDSGIDVAIQILDKSNKHALFYKKQMLGGHNFVFNPLIVKKTELEAASCLNEDSFTITCTLTFLLDGKQQQEEKGTITMVGDGPCPWNSGTTDD